MYTYVCTVISTPSPLYRICFDFRGVKLSQSADQQPSAKVSSRENLGQSGNRVCSLQDDCLTKVQKWQLFARATWYAAKNLHRSNWLHQYDKDLEEMTNQHHGGASSLALRISWWWRSSIESHLTSYALLRMYRRQAFIDVSKVTSAVEQDHMLSGTGSFLPVYWLALIKIRCLYSFILGPQTTGYPRSGESCSLLSGKGYEEGGRQWFAKVSSTHFAIAIIP